jgi:Mrp family chromosome partitioning ATPase
MTGPTFAPPAHTAGSQPKAAGSGPRGNKPGTKADDGAGLRVLTYLRLHWLFILFCGTLLGTAGALSAWELLASKYDSYAMLQVSSVPTALANHGNPNQARTDFTTYVRTTAHLIKSEFVLNAALRDIKDLPTIKSQSDPIKFLEEELQVVWQDGSEVIRITFKSHEPQDARKIVDAVQKAFMAEVVQKDVAEKQQFLQRVKEAELDIQRILAPFSTEAKKDEKGTVVPAGGAAAGGPGAAPSALAEDLINHLDPRILIGQLVQARERVGQLPLTIRDAERRAAVLEVRLEELRKAPVPKAIEEMVDKDQDVVVEKVRTNAAKTLYEKWKNASRDPAHPSQAVVDLRSAYEQQEQEWRRVRQDKLDTLNGAHRVQQARPIAAELEEVKRSVQRYQEQLDHSKALLERGEKKLIDLPLPTEMGPGGIMAARFEKSKYKPDDSVLGSVDAIFRKLIEQYHMVRMELSSPPRVRILQGASHPTQKDTKKQVLGTSFAGIMGFVLVAMGAVGYETMSRRVSSLADVTGSVAAPVVGVVPCPPGRSAERDPVKRAAANEAIDKLRTYVSQTWLSRGATTIAVTSPVADEGKALTAFGLASSLAQAGYKTLLADFDLRQPALHTFAGVANANGACELLRGETDSRGAIQFLPSGLHFLPAGKWSDEARKAATGERLENLLAKLKEPYDCLVLHGHAILTAAEAVEVARRCEVVLVCARYRETATPLLKRAADRIAAMEIPYSGIVYIGSTEQEALC